MKSIPATFDRRLYAGMAVVACLVVLVGFSPTLYLRAWFDTPPISGLLYFHGVLMTTWYGLFFTQVVLVGRRRVDLHRRLGVIAAICAGLMVPTGIAVAISFIVRLHDDPHWAPIACIIAGYDFVSLIVFALLVASALRWRRRSDIHKRLMTVASISLLGPALARFAGDQLAVLLLYAILLIPVALDTWRHRRLHPAYGVAVGVVLLTTQASLFLAASPAWIHFALNAFQPS